MKNKYAILLTLLIFLTASAAMAVTELSGLHLKWLNNETVLKIDLSGPYQFSHQTEISKDGKPFRVIVDVFPVVHKLSQKIFTQLPVSIVSALRTSQYAVSPEKTVRIVLDLKNSSVYRIEKSGQFLFIYIPDSENPDFAEWSNVGDKQIAIAETSTIPQADANINNSAPVQEIKTDIDKLVAEVNETETPANNFADKTGDVIAENSVPAESAPVAEVAVINAPPPAPAKPNYYRPQRSRFIDETPPVAVVKPVAPIDNPPVVAEVKPATANINFPVVASEIPTETKSEIKTEEPVLASLTVTTAHKKATSESSAAPVQSPEKPVASIPVEKEKVATVPIPVATDSQVNSEDIYFDENVVAEAVSPDDMPAVDETESVARPTSRFRREPVSPIKMKGTIVAEFPQRMVLEYASSDFRDPFETLVDETRQSNEQRENRIPDVETSRLVGILESENGRDRVLLEDLDGYGYILKIGDKVKKGFVDKIDSEKALFQLFEYGWSRTIALYLGRN
jgi:hypothetical protein